MRHVANQPNNERGKPLTEPVLLILLSLAEKPRHGYAFDERHRESERRPGPAEHRYALRRAPQLLQDNWIEPFALGDTSREKQAYKLTSAGRKGLQGEVERMRQLTQAATGRVRMREA